MGKKELLSTKMNQLGLGGAFNRWFTTYNANGKLDQTEVLTLAEFFSLNQAIKTNKDSFVCRKKVGDFQTGIYGFLKESKSYIKLKEYLFKNEFTFTDWVLLLPDIETPKGKRPNYTLLSKDMLLNLPYSNVTGIRESSSSARQISYYYHEIMRLGDHESPLSVKQVMSFTEEQVTTMSMRIVGKMLKNVQRKFKDLGFGLEDGPFMKIKFPKSKSENDYIEDFVKYRGFTRRDAKMAVKFAIKAKILIVEEN